MKLNTPAAPVYNHEGVRAKHINPEQQLRRSVMACMLWESEFYEDGQAIAARISETIKLVEPGAVAAIAVEAREKMKLRHVPLLIVREMARLKTHRAFVGNTLARVIQRPDELAEFLAIYWKDGKCPLSAQVKRGLARAFGKFDAFALAKYSRDGAIKLRDVLFLCHAKAATPEQDATWKQLIAGTLPTPDTWEVALSAATGATDEEKAAAKRGVWTRLLAEKKLGALALLRNLRNMEQAKVDDVAIRKALTDIKAERVLPFRFIAAARHAPRFEPELEIGMFRCFEGRFLRPGKTLLLVDTSPSMNEKLSSKSDLCRKDAAFGLAVLLRELCAAVEIVAFSRTTGTVPPRRGFALADAIARAVPSDGTLLGAAVRAVSGRYDRIVVITDEESQDAVTDPDAGKQAYLINVASTKNGVGYGAWLHVDGWSEAVVDYITTAEITA